MANSTLRFSIILFVACLAVCILAARGTFTSASGFPLIFGLVCLVLGLISAVRDGPRSSRARRAAIVVIGAALAVGGWFLQGRWIERQVARLQAEVEGMVVGREAPALVTFEALNSSPAAVEEAASFAAKATIVTFWARWCTPCEKEMPELESLYRAHRDRGLRILALTRYDQPEDGEERQRDTDKAKRYLERRDLTFPAAITADTGVYRGFEVRSIPSSALVDHRGVVVAYGVGLAGARALMREAAAMIGADET